jgi:hypothetical protein
MKREIKICQNCKREFTIKPEDFEFYQKIKVPPPTWCPECRLIRRMVWRNERNLYKRKCNLCGKSILSIYSPDTSFILYCDECWWSDKWNPLEYGRNYDFSKSFFEQIGELMKKVPVQGLNISNCENCNYCFDLGDSKNCYLVFGGSFCEDSIYLTRCVSCKNCIDLSFSDKNELCYESLFSRNCFRLFFSRYCEDCSDSYFLLNCRDCHNCFCCVNLRHKKYHIFNRAYDKKDYYLELEKLELGSYNSLVKLKEEFKKFLLRYPHKFAYIINSQEVVGDNILYPAKNCFFCFETSGNLEDCKYLVYCGYQLKDSYDCFASGINGELLYELLVGVNNTSNSQYSIRLKNSYNIKYSFACFSCQNLFGCIGLRHKQYCILNKQYTKEEYEKLVPKIIDHMEKMPYIDKKGRIYKYGEFFPPELSPFCYNETIAQEYFPLTKEKAIEKGFKWKELKEREIKIDILNDKLPDNIKDVDDSIIGKIIECKNAKFQMPNDKYQMKDSEFSNCTQAFKIIPQELEFYRKMNLPLPRYCPNCRHYQRIKQRNPLKLWKRKCMCGGLTSTNKIYKNTREHFHGKDPCPNEFETTYSPERPEIVYCEKCYLAEII